MSYGLTDPLFWGYAVLFLLAFYLSCYLPGSLVCKRFQLPTLTHILLASSLGIILWGIQGYVLGYLHLRWVSFAIPPLALFFSWRHRQLEQQRLGALFSQVKQLKTRVWLPLTITVIGSLIQVLQVAGTALRYGPGIAFFRVNAFDGMLHLSFMASIMRQFPPQQPGAVGLPITNYHYWSDLVMAELARVWNLPLSHSFFQFWPVVLSLLTGLATYLLIKTWTHSRLAGSAGLLFLFFGADVAYLAMLALHQQWGFTVAAIDNGATQFLNMPHSFAKLLFISGLLPFTYWSQRHQWQWGLITALFVGTMVGFKVYFGMFACLGLTLAVSYYVLHQLYQQLYCQKPRPALATVFRSVLPVLVILLATGLMALAIFLPPNRNAGSLFWSPLEWPKLFLSRDQLNFEDWWLRKQVYEAAGNQKAILVLDGLAIAICLLAVYGNRLIGGLTPFLSRKKLSFEIWLFLIPGTLLFTILGLYTLQTSGLFNVFNFFAVASVPLALLSSIAVWQLWESRRWWLRVIVVLTIVSSWPRIGYHAYQAVADQITFHYQELYRPAELAALTFLREQTPSGSVIQSHQKNYLDQNTPYIAYFADRPTFLTGVGMLQSHNQPIQGRKAELAQMFASTSSLELANQLRSHQIDYLYLQKKPDQLLGFELESSNLEVVFENEAAMILRPR